jgi:hypothetical protein
MLQETQLLTFIIFAIAPLYVYMIETRYDGWKGVLTTFAPTIVTAALWGIEFLSPTSNAETMMNAGLFFCLSQWATKNLTKDYRWTQHIVLLVIAFNLLLEGNTSIDSVIRGGCIALLILLFYSAKIYRSKELQGLIQQMRNN